MARSKLTAHKHVRMPPLRCQTQQESESDGLHASYFLRTLLRSLGYYEAPLYIGLLTLFHGSTYVWNVHVVPYEKATTDCICCIG
jgi:hypothetical protein